MDLVDKNRLESLSNRRERLIEANGRKRYIDSKDKAERYFRCLNYLRAETLKRESENRVRNSNISEALKSTKGMSGFQILMAQK